MSLPITDTAIDVSGITDRVTISRTAQSVPRVSAKNDLDVYFGLGFVHAQDRLWQMEMSRRIGSGRLSEVLGNDSLSSDIFMRTLDLRRGAERIWQRLPEKERQVLRHYVAGVNEGIKQLRQLPPEFAILQYQPEPWKPQDSLVWMQLMSWQLSSNYGFEIHRTLLVQALGPEKANLLLPKVDLRHMHLAGLLDQRDFRFDELLGQAENPYYAPAKFIGSNSWVISGEHTASKKPLLANDPHLANTMPTLWYLAELSGDRLHAIGATFPGLPFVVIGKNRDISWGLTNLLADTQDIFLEKLNPLNKNEYEVDGRYLKMQVRREEIKIRKDFLRREQRPRTINIRRTVHGPVLSDVVGELQEFAYSLRWTGDDEDGGSFSALLQLNYASNWDEFRDALKTFVAPAHIFVYADGLGNIGHIAPGLFPLRAQGDGSVPSIGWKSANQWQGWIPRAEVPSAFNPKEGFIVTANNKIVGDDYPYHLSSDWAPDYRSDRITAEISRLIAAKRSKLTAEDMVRLQLDVQTPGKSSILSHLQSLPPKTERQKQILDVLKSWDGRMSADSSAASIFASWTGHFYHLLIEDDINAANFAPAARQSLTRMVNNIHLPLLEDILSNQHRSDVCDYKTTQARESCNDILYAALDHAINELSQRLDNDRSQWSSLHKTQFPHFPFSKHELAPANPYAEDSFFHHFFHREAGTEGGAETVNAAPFSLGDNSRFLQFFGATYRQIIDMGGSGKSYFISATGQSGNPISPHYDDFISLYAEGRYLPMSTQASAGVLQLQPSDGR